MFCSTTSCLSLLPKGTSISVFGILPDANTSSPDAIVISLDNDQGKTIPLHSNFSNEPLALIYQSPTLDPGNHILQLDVKALTDGHAIGIDFVVYTATYTSMIW